MRRNLAQCVAVSSNCVWKMYEKEKEMKRTLRSPIHMIAMSACMSWVVVQPVHGQGTAKRAPVEKPAAKVLEAKPAAKAEPREKGDGHTHNLARFVLDPDEVTARTVGVTQKTRTRDIEVDESAANSAAGQKGRRSKERKEVNLKDPPATPNGWKRNDFDGDGIPNLTDRHPFDPRQR